MNIKDLSIEEKVGQKFIFGVNLNNVEIIKKLIKNCYIGGVILYKKNYNSYDEMIDLIKSFKDANKDSKIPLFIAIDQENGKVNRLPNEIHLIRNMHDVSKVDKKMVTDVAEITSSILKDIGINMNFAPSIDIDNNSKSKVLYKRCFYGNIDYISECALRYVDAFCNNGVIAVVKHFPGHGATSIDSHFMVPYVHNYQEVINKHMIPFQEMMKHNCDAMMIGHLIVRNLTSGWPASASSKFIKEYIRDKFSYDNLIITDEVGMLSNKLLYRYDKYLNKVFISDNDIILSKIKNVNEGYSMIKKYLDLIQSEKITLEQLDDSVSRIIRMKNKYKIDDSTNYKGINLKEVNKKIDMINDRVNG